MSGSYYGYIYIFYLQCKLTYLKIGQKVNVYVLNMLLRKTSNKQTASPLNIISENQ